MPMSIQVTGLDELRRKVGPDLYRPEVRKAMEKSLEAIEDRAKKLAPVDTGRLRASITHKLQRAPVAGAYGWVGSSLPYAAAVHEGRRAGARMPPVSAIRSWLARKGGDTSMAFVVARAIGRRGIKGRPFLRNAMAQSRDKVDTQLDRAARAVEVKWGKG